MVEHKAFELAVRDSEYRKTRIDELRKKMRSSFGAIWSSVLVGALFLIVNYRQPIGVNHFFASIAIFSMVLGRLYQISRFRNEARILQMLEIQEQVSALRTSAL